MTDQLISFDTAVKAKEKKFNWSCRSYYMADEPGKVFSGAPSHYNNHEVEIWEGEHTYYSAPTQSLLQKWLREEKGLLVFCVPQIWFGDNKLEWGSVVHNQFLIPGDKELTNSTNWSGDDGGIWFTDKECFSTYELALEAGLLKALDLIRP